MISRSCRDRDQSKAMLRHLEWECVRQITKEKESI